MKTLPFGPSGMRHPPPGANRPEHGATFSSKGKRTSRAARIFPDNASVQALAEGARIAALMKDSDDLNCIMAHFEENSVRRFSKKRPSDTDPPERKHARVFRYLPQPGIGLPVYLPWKKSSKSIQRASKLKFEQITLWRFYLVEACGRLSSLTLAASGQKPVC